MKTMAERIKDLRDSKAQATEQEQVKIQGKIDMLEDLQREGVFTQADLNRVDSQNKEALTTLREEIKTTMGAPWEEVKQTLSTIEQSIVDNSGGTSTDTSATTAEGTDPKGDAGNLLESLSGELKSEREARLQLERELRSNDVTSRLDATLKNLGLQDAYLSPAKSLISYDDLVEKAMKRETVTDEELQERAKNVQTLSPVWFGPKPGDPTVYPGVPLTPEGGEPRQLTDEEREARSESVI